MPKKALNSMAVASGVALSAGAATGRGGAMRRVSVAQDLFSGRFAELA